MPGTIQIVLPGLFDLPLAELEPEFVANELPALNRLLRLATPRSSRAFTIDAIIQTVLIPESPARQSSPGLPLAQAFAPPELGDPDRLLLCRAVHLQPDLYSAVIVPIPGNEENLKDINIIINDLGDLFNVDCDMTAIAEGLFLMHLKACDAPTHYPHILSVLGKAANPYIEQSRLILPWYKLLNEMQMFMHQHEVNRDRIGRGLLPINSLWFWGAGSMPQRTGSRPAWYCDDSVLNRFAASLGLKTAPLESVAALEHSADTVVVDLRLIELLKTGIATEPEQLLLEIDDSLLQPLSSLARRNRKSLWLRAGYQLDFELPPMASLKFWRRPRTLAAWAAQ